MLWALDAPDASWPALPEHRDPGRGRGREGALTVVRGPVMVGCVPAARLVVHVHANISPSGQSAPALPVSAPAHTPDTAVAQALLQARERAASRAREKRR